jgi:hypothetical protein
VLVQFLNSYMQCGPRIMISGFWTISVRYVLAKLGSLYLIPFTSFAGILPVNVLAVFSALPRMLLVSNK